MALDLTDTELDALAERARRVLNAPSKLDAVRQALERVVETEPTGNANLKAPALSPDERIDRIRKKYNMPPYATLEPFDEKAFLDEMWGENDVHR